MAGTTLTAQINVRMSKTLKEQGDAGLSTLGVTPTEAIRRLWEYAASGDKGLQKLSRFFEDSSDATPNEQELEQLRAVDKGRSLFNAYLRELGVPEERAQELAAPERTQEALDLQVQDDKALLVENLLARHGYGTEA